jgi:arylsulfatase A
VRIGDYKVVKQGLNTRNPGPWEVYDLSKDRSEQRDLSATHQDKVDEALQILRTEVAENEFFPVPIP